MIVYSIIHEPSYIPSMAIGRAASLSGVYPFQDPERILPLVTILEGFIWHPV